MQVQAPCFCFFRGDLTASFFSDYNKTFKNIEVFLKIIQKNKKENAPHGTEIFEDV